MNLAQHGELLNQSQLLLAHTHDLSSAANNITNSTSELSHLLENFELVLNDLTSICTEFLGTGGGNDTDLGVECRELVDDAFIPSISPNVSTLGGRSPNGQTLLQVMVEILDNKTFAARATVDRYSPYLEDLVSVHTCMCMYMYMHSCSSHVPYNYMYPIPCHSPSPLLPPPNIPCSPYGWWSWPTLR